MKRRKTMLLLIVVLVGGIVFAYVVGGSNFTLAEYSRFTKMKPYKPYSSSVSQYEYDRYRNEVQAYLDDAKEYVKNADYDIQRIEEAQKKVTDLANSAVEEFNSWNNLVTIKKSY